MNSDETTRYVTIAVMILSPILIRWGVDATTASTIISGATIELITLAPALGAAAFAIWHGWNKRLVHETAVVTQTAPTVAVAKAMSIPAGK